MTLPILFGIAGFALTLASAFTCHLIDVKGADTMNQVRGLGPWTIQGKAPILINGRNYETDSSSTVKGIEDTVIGGIERFASDHGAEFTFGGDANACYSWSHFGGSTRDLFDTELFVARIFSMAAVVLGLFLMIKLLFFACCGSRSFGCTSFLCFLESLFVGLTFLMTDSFYCKDADTCELGHTAIFCGVATGIWFLVGVFLSCMPRVLRRAAVAASGRDVNDQDVVKV
jgi:hypothetical protein